MNPWMCPRCKKINNPTLMQCFCSELTNPYFKTTEVYSPLTVVGCYICKQQHYFGQACPSLNLGDK